MFPSPLRAPLTRTLRPAMLTTARTSALVAALAIAACSPAGSGSGGDTQPFAASAPSVYIVNIADGDTVSSPVRVVFGLSGRGIAPAGVDAPNTGHHHLIIDTTLEGEALEYAIPNDEYHRHFGGGQTETVIELTPGEHTLQLILGDHGHVPFDPLIASTRITITVR